MSVTEKETPFDLEALNIKDLPDLSNALYFEDQPTENVGKKYIVFLINDISFAIASDKIAEVVRPMNYTNLPSVPEWILGIANLRGDIISIIDLQNLLNLAHEEVPKSKLIVLSSPNSPPHIAFKVHKVREIVAFPEEDIYPFDDEENSFIEGQIELKSNNIYLLNVDEILTSLQIN